MEVKYLTEFFRHLQNLEAASIESHFTDYVIFRDVDLKISQTLLDESL